MRTLFGAIVLAVIMFLNTSVFGQGIGKVSEEQLDKLLDAIVAVETGGESDPDNAVGDGGKALGAFQVWRSYWVDAVERNPHLKSRGYAAVKDRAYARQIVIAYFKRYAPKNATMEDLARIHNGGPKGYKKDSTQDYWVKVQRALEE